MTRANQEAPLTSGPEDKKNGESFSAPAIVLSFTGHSDYVYLRMFSYQVVGGWDARKIAL